MSPAPEKNPYNMFLASLRAARKAKNLSQGDVAKLINLSRAQYTAIENGRSVVSFVHLHNLATALHLRFVIGDPSNPILR